MFSTKNVDIIRLADIYLMYAEVMLKLNSADVATEYVNKVRRRAWGESNYDVPGTKEKILRLSLWKYFKKNATKNYSLRIPVGMTSVVGEYWSRNWLNTLQQMQELYIMIHRTIIFRSLKVK